MKVSQETTRKDFPILHQKIRGKPLIYLDNSATSLTPVQVIEAMNEYYLQYRANVHRSIHTLGEKATEAFIDAHKKIASLINAESWEDIVMTRGTTEGINIAARIIGKTLKKGDEIVLTVMEHHSNLVPWQQLAKEKGAVVKYIGLTKEGSLNEKNMNEVITSKTKVVACTYVSNVLGTINDIQLIAAQAQKVGAYCLVDAAQAIPHMKIDVQALGCDMLCFSGHKMYGPTGIGALYLKKKIAEQADPILFGGDMIQEVFFTHATWNELPWKFEAGTPDIAGAIGLGRAAEYLQEKREEIERKEKELTAYALQQLQTVKGLQLFGPKKAENRAPVFSFVLGKIHAHDIVALLDQEGIAVRGGHLCAMPLIHEILQVNDVCRASFAFYNAKEEVDKLIEGLKKIQEIFR